MRLREWWLMGHTPPGISTTGVSLGPILFNVFISDLEEGLEFTLIQSADDPKLREQMDPLEDQTALLGNLDMTHWRNQPRRIL